MTTPTSTSSNREFAPDERARPLDRTSSSLKRTGRAIAHDLDDAPTIMKRDALARGVMRIAVLALEIVALALAIMGALGVLQQLGTAESLGPSLLLPIFAIIVVTGLGALFALALAAGFVTILKINTDVATIKATVGVADQNQAGSSAVGNGRSATAA